MVDAHHPRYDENLEKWVRARDVIAGGDRIKEQGMRYLPRLDSQTDGEYAAYLERASFYNATGRTLDGFAGMIFRREPVVKLPEGDLWEKVQSDIDLLGTSFYLFTKDIVQEVMAVGRAGTLVEWENAEARPFVVKYSAEQILNWRMSRMGGRMVLSMVVLHETVEEAGDEGEFSVELVSEIRVLTLEGLAKLRVDVWRQAKQEGGDGKKKPEWEKIKTRYPSRRGQFLDFIPFVIHGPNGDGVEPQKPPLEDIIAVNIDHFRLDADHKHGLHYTALPTAWVAGFDKDSVLRIGSSTAWVSENADARAGYLEFVGQGLQAFEKEKDRDERLMAILGSRLLESQKRVSESAEALSLRQAGESSIVANISSSLSKSLTKILRWSYWWTSTEENPEDIPLETVSVELNKDFETATMTAQELVAVVQAWQAGIMSHDSALNLLRQGEMLPPSRTNEEELELIEAQPPPLMGAPASLKKVHAAEAGNGGGSLQKDRR